MFVFDSSELNSIVILQSKISACRNVTGYSVFQLNFNI